MSGARGYTTSTCYLAYFTRRYHESFCRDDMELSRAYSLRPSAGPVGDRLISPQIMQLCAKLFVIILMVCMLSFGFTLTFIHLTLPILID